MKKAILVILTLMFITVLCSCNSDGSADIWIFSECFNEQSEIFQIELSDITAITNDNKTKEYECFIKTENGKKILLTLNSEIDGTISSLSVTAASDDKISPDAFCDVSKIAAAVLTQETGEDIPSVFDSLGMTNPQNIENTVSSYHETSVCRYSLISNSEGIAFIAELSIYIESTDEPLSLRETSKVTSEHKNDCMGESAIEKPQ